MEFESTAVGGEGAGSVGEDPVHLLSHPGIGLSYQMCFTIIIYSQIVVHLVHNQVLWTVPCVDTRKAICGTFLQSPAHNSNLGIFQNQ